MNGVLIDEYSSEYKNRMKNITLFPSPVMLDTLAVIEEIFKEFVDDNDQAFRQVKGPSMFWIEFKMLLSLCRTCCFLNLQNSIWI